MPTPDPIALPESGAKPYKCDYCGQFYGARACCDMRYDYLRHHGEKILPPESSLTHAPQVPGDMALCNAILRHQFQDEHRGGRLTVDVETLLHDYNAHKATPPLNELLGQPEEFNLNELSRNPEQLASLEQRARVLGEVEALLRSADELGLMVDTAVPLETLRAITAALSAHTISDEWTPALCSWLEQRGILPDGPFDENDLIAALNDHEAALSAQPRHVEAAACTDGIPDDSLTAAYMLGKYDGRKAAPQPHAAGVEGVGLLNETERSGLNGLLANLEYEAGDVYDSPPSNEDDDAYWPYYQWHAITKLLGIEKGHTTPPPGVDVGKLRDLVDDLAGESREEWDKSQDYQWAEWVRDRHNGKSTGLADAAGRLKKLLDGIDASAPGVQP